MIAYTFVVVEGCIHEQHMEVQLGTLHYGICCTALRRLICQAKEVGICKVLEHINPEESEREMFTFLYEEFKDKV